VIPGLVDMQSRLGLPEDEARGVRKGGPSLGGPAGGSVKVSRALVLRDPAFRQALEAGITTTVVTPGGGGFLGGQAVALKCGGDDLEARIIRDPAGIRFNVSAGRGSIATPWSIRSQLKRIRDYAARRKGEKPPPEDESMEALIPLLEGEIPAYVRVSTPEEILATLDVFVKEYKIRTVLVGAERAHAVAQEIRDCGASVAAGPVVRRREEGDWIHLPLRLAETGVPIALQSSGATGSASLPMAAAYAVRHGLDEATALKALTLWPAQMARIEDRVGSIDVGKDADIVILSGDPMDLGSHIQKVYLQGELVHEE
jgi:imidazolonepropionase-like amidohydrolase